ncbi:helix-turn-helix domain-containing protein [Paraburkholderia saeva]|uniref:HTH-type transcriptional activator RhaS n=1 Tax=Paraburkholderia saeva TaxID=2777537 RepID=A0A9N8RVP0_9BURK|nr:AraC family transcriptional regulator [Paraburkholderia saeva]CAG4886195.1 HTH-type transcriptional activator RhaS [Paraburkholderia saeva]CAG4893719.1 HTH-type transcriptional activator RhaS [Paraburkholderia saeva]CAG4907988.1 HTH-type transcriptional activator RhaS [Paraburkholderia saeva]
MDHHAAIVRPTVSLRRYGATEATDVHDFHQVVLGLDGAMVMAVDGVGREIDSRSAWLIPAGARHDYAGIGENRQLVLDLPASSLAVPQRLFDRARAVEIDGSLTELVRTVAASAPGAAYADDEAWARQFNWNTAARLCAAILSDSGATKSGAGALPALGLDFARIDRWLRAHLSEPLRIADLAAHCGFGMRRFHQLFIEAFGETPHRYLQRLRLDTSLTLLADPRHTLSHIALDIGFGDQSAFTHAFTRRFGLAPGQWRALQH